ncbi:MAG: DUF2203 domain-containing protein [Rubrobacter sp.]|nr:DUF2203 domain-containing protein [Rubrobacter sp.]
MDPAFERLFTVEEANALIPTLRGILDELALHRDALRERAPDMQPILEASTGNGGGRVGSEYSAETYNLYLTVERIRKLGVVLKDLDMGLLDFPHEREGRIVFLCWHPPEENVAYWHDLDAGYAGRQPL